MSLTRVVGLLLLLSGAIHCAAAPHKIDLMVDMLELKNGKSFRSAALRTYDPINGRVVLVADRQVSSLQIELFPDALAERIRAMVPSEEKDERRAGKEELRQAQRERSRQQEANKAAADRASANRAAQSQANAEERKSAALQENIRRKAKSAALNRAVRYFQYEQKQGSGSTVTINRRAEVEEPVEVTGWKNRYRVKGTIGLEYYDSYGKSFNRTTRSFEVLVEGDDNGNVKVVDISAS